MNLSPNHNWKPGDKINSPSGNIIGIDPTEQKAEMLYKLLIGSIIPRPIAFVSTINEAGVVNLAPFSFFNGVCSNPPSLMISIARKPNGDKKDSLRNIEATGQFVVNSANKWLIEPLIYCAATHPFGVDEMQKSGLTPLPSEKIKPPRVKESALQMECEVYQLVQVGDGSAGSSTVIIGKIVKFHVYESVYQNGKIVNSEYQAAARLGGINYDIAEELFSRPIPDLADIT